MIHSKQHWCRIQDLGTRGKHQTKTKNRYGAEFRTLGPVATGGEKQPAFRTVRAQRTVRPLNLGHPNYPSSRQMQATFPLCKTSCKMWKATHISSFLFN